jgi:hypothetical protein
MAGGDERVRKMINLSETLKLCLHQADSLKLDLTGIHILNAIYAIDHELGQCVAPTSKSAQES